MATITRGQIKTRALQITDYENSDFASEPELNQWTNDGYLSFFDLLASTLENFYIADPVDVTVSSGSSEIDLSTVLTRFYLLKGLDFNYEGNKYYKVPSFNFADRNIYDGTIAEGNSRHFDRRRYRLLGNKIKLVPTDTASGNYRIWYVAEPTQLDDDSDSFENYNGWGEFVVQYVAKKIKIKAEEDYRPFEMEMAFLRARISEIAKNRDTNKVESVTDVERPSVLDGYY